MNMPDVFPSWNDDYVDIHGRKLKIMVDDNGAIFVPFSEIRKTGFHIFPESNYQPKFVGKSLLMREFNLHMLGAAQEYLIQNNVHSLTQDDILQTIELCRKEFLSNDIQNENGHIGTLGRTLLSDPVSINREVKVVMHNKLQQVSEDNVKNQSNAFSNHNNRQYQEFEHQKQHSGNILRLPKQNCLDIKQPSNPNLQNNKNEIQPNQNTNLKRNTKTQIQNYTSNNRAKQTFNNNDKDQERNGSLSKLGGKNESSSGTSESGDQEYMKLSDLKHKKIELDTNMQKVKVVFVENHNEKEKYWVQLEKNEDVVLEILKELNDCEDKKRVSSPKLGEMYMAICDQDQFMYRVVVMRTKPMIKVHFIDFGNMATVKEVYHLSEDVAKIPAQAVRIIVSRPSEQQGQTAQKLEEGQILSVKYLKQFADTTILVHTEKSLMDNNQNRKRNNVTFDENRHDNNIHVRLDAKDEQPKQQQQQQQIFMTQMKFSTKLNEGEEVKIVSQKNGKFYLRNKEHHRMYRDVVQHIKELTKNPLNCFAKNQLVLCKKDGEEEMCRAIIENIDDGLANVRYVDFQTPDTVALKTLRSVSKLTASLPIALIESPRIKGYDDSFTDQALSLIEEYAMANIKLKVLSVSPEFDLICGNDSLSKLLFPHQTQKTKIDLKPKSELVTNNNQSTNIVSPSTSSVQRQPKSATPPPPTPPSTTRSVVAEEQTTTASAVKTPPTATVATPQKVVFTDLKVYEAPVGLADYMLTSCSESLTEFTVVSNEERVLDSLGKVTAIDVADDEWKLDHELETADMVLAKYQDEWYRAVVTEAESEPYNVMLVDFGNEFTVYKKDIKKFPHHLAKIEILGLICSFDLTLNEAASKRLKELLVIEDIYQLNILSFDADAMSYAVRMPKVEALLAKEGLL